MAEQPEVAVVVPCWGPYVELLPDALRSFAGERAPYRIVVVDNASEAPVAERLAGVAGLPAGIEVLRLEERLRIGPVRDAAIRATDEPWLLFFDADDILLPGTLDFLHERAVAAPDAVMVSCHPMDWVPETGAVTPRGHPPRIAYRTFRRPWLFNWLNMRISITFLGGATLLRRAALVDSHDRATGAWFADTPWGEDWILGAAMLWRGRTLLFKRPGRLYRQHPISIMATRQVVATGPGVRRELRRRVARDPGVPLWVKATLPLLWASHRRVERQERREAP